MKREREDERIRAQLTIDIRTAGDRSNESRDCMSTSAQKRKWRVSLNVTN